MLTVSALCKEGCNWSREKWRESRKPLGHKWWRLLADSDVPSVVISDK